MTGFLIRVAVTGVAVLVASWVVAGITIDSLAAGVVGVLTLAVLNAVVRPVLYVLSAPFIVVTLGLFMVAINAFLLSAVSVFVTGFHVAGGWSAVGGAVVISLVSMMMNLMISARGRVEIVRPRRMIKHIN